MLTCLQPEWYSDIIIPWYHYVPLQMDYSDLWDIMAFFEGAPDGSTPANLDLAQRIGDSGKQFVEEHWRVEDLHSFSLLQILEVSSFSLSSHLCRWCGQRVRRCRWATTRQCLASWATPGCSTTCISTLTVYQYQRMWSSDRKKASFRYEA
jgi:hypothetical protein